MTEAFTRQQYTWQELTRDLDTAQELEQIEAAGDYVRVDEASDPKAHVYVRLGDPFGPRRKLRLGGSIDGAEFGRLYLDWPAQSREDSTVPWVKLIIARTYGAVRFQNPDPIELDITGLVKIAPHVIAEGGRRADHRYDLALEPIIRNTVAQSYTAGDVVGTTPFESSPGFGGATLVGDTFWTVDLGDYLREWNLDGELLNQYSYNGWGEGLAYDSKRRRIAVTDQGTQGTGLFLRMFSLFSRAFSGDQITLPNEARSAAYDPFGDRFIVAAYNSAEFWVLDAEDGTLLDTWSAPNGNPAWEVLGMLDAERVLVHRSTNSTYIIDADDGSVVEDPSWELGGTNGGGVSRGEGLVYVSDALSNIKRIAWRDVSYSAEGYATAGACGGTSLIEPEDVKVYGEIEAKRLDSGKVRVQGEVIRTALELHFGARMPADYLDHVYLARFERTGRVVGAGAETWASAGVADNFLLELPQRITLTIDSDLEPIY